MDKVEYLGVREAAALEGISPNTLLARYRRKRIILAEDPEDSRRKLVPVSALSMSAYREWMKGQTVAALQGIGGQAQDAPIDQEKPEQAIAPAVRDFEEGKENKVN